MILFTAVKSVTLASAVVDVASAVTSVHGCNCHRRFLCSACVLLCALCRQFDLKSVRKTICVTLLKIYNISVIWYVQC